MENKLLRKNFTYLSLVQVANYLIPFITLPYITRTVGTGNYGRIELAQSLTLYFILFINFGFEVSATRRIAKGGFKKERISSIFSQVLSLKLVFFLISLAILTGFLAITGDLFKEPLVFYTSFLSTVGYVLIPMYIFQGLQNLRPIAIWHLLSKVVSTAGIFLFIQHSNDYPWVPFWLSTAPILVGIFALLYAKQEYGIRFMRPEKRLWSLHLKEGSWLFLLNFLSTVNATLFIIVLGYNVSDAEAGYFAGANKLILVAISLVLGPFTQAFFPHLLSMNHPTIREFRMTLYKAAGFLGGVMIAGSIVTWFLAPWIVSVLFGEGFEPIVPVLRLLSLTLVFDAMKNVFGFQGLLSKKKEKPYFFLQLVGLAVGVGLLFSWSGLTAEGAAYIRIGVDATVMLLTVMSFHYYVR
ncbi:MAG: oligosaccharide flippase family protein [Bacteroidota bacterium]|nr:oligosaccharide flippase family protein [Bacteroidota bacterium]